MGKKEDFEQKRNILKGKLVTALRKSGRTKTAGEVEECNKNFQLFKAKGHNLFRAIPFSCKNRLCPYCSRKRSGKLLNQLSASIEKMKNPKLLTLTVKNTPKIDSEYFKWLRGCFSRLRRRKFFKDACSGGFYAIETTYNKESKEWHVHMHALIDSGYMSVEDWIDAKGKMKKGLRSLWKEITGGSWGVDIRQADYKAGKEVLKYITKVADFVDYPERVDEYLAATKGSRLFHTFGNVHNFNEDLNDEDDLNNENQNYSWEFLRTIKKGDTYEDEDGFVWTWQTLAYGQYEDKPPEKS